jgi:Tfp pilus assembly protein PilF
MDNTYGIPVMSLINQMLRDLESRRQTNDAPSTLQHTIQATPSPAPKTPLLAWSLLVIIATGGAYWAYQYSKAPSKTFPVIVANTIKKDPTPIAPFEKVLSAPNAAANTASNTEQKPPENTATPPAPVAQAAPVVQPIPATQTIPAAQTPPTIQPDPPAQSVQPTPTVQTAPEIIAAPPVKQIPAAPKPAVIQQTTAKQRADLLYRQAENNAGDYSAAIYKLEQALNLDPRHIKARLLLAKTLLNQGQTSKTVELLDQGLALFPDNLQLINTRAQLFLQQKNPDGALRTLQRVDAANSTNEIYLSLLAATYQQLQSFTNAANVYQKLITINPEKAENWLGFALAQEKLGNPKVAREAYQQALSKNALKESIVSYIKQRLTELR